MALVIIPYLANIFKLVSLNKTHISVSWEYEDKYKMMLEEVQKVKKDADNKVKNYLLDNKDLSYLLLRAHHLSSLPAHRLPSYG